MRSRSIFRQSFRSGPFILLIPQLPAEQRFEQDSQTDRAPAAIGPYSQAIQADSLVYLAGQLPLDPASMEITDGNFETRARRVFDNLGNIAQAAGGDLDKAVKITIYLTDLDNFSIINQVMADYFSEPYPARAVVGVAALPKGADVEADAVLVLQD